MPELLPPKVKRHIRDGLLPADFPNAFSVVYFPQNADFVIGAMEIPYHGLDPFF